MHPNLSMPFGVIFAEGFFSLFATSPYYSYLASLLWSYVVSSLHSVYHCHLFSVWETIGPHWNVNIAFYHCCFVVLMFPHHCIQLIIVISFGCWEALNATIVSWYFCRRTAVLSSLYHERLCCIYYCIRSTAVLLSVHLGSSLPFGVISSEGCVLLLPLPCDYFYLTSLLWGFMLVIAALSLSLSLVFDVWKAFLYGLRRSVSMFFFIYYCCRAAVSSSLHSPHHCRLFLLLERRFGIALSKMWLVFSDVVFVVSRSIWKRKRYPPNYTQF